MVPDGLAALPAAELARLHRRLAAEAARLAAEEPTAAQVVADSALRALLDALAIRVFGPAGPAIIAAALAEELEGA